MFICFVLATFTSTTISALLVMALYAKLLGGGGVIRRNIHRKFDSKSFHVEADEQRQESHTRTLHEPPQLHTLKFGTTNTLYHGFPSVNLVAEAGTWEDDTELHQTQVGCKDVSWTQLAQDRVQWQALLLAVLNRGILLPEVQLVCLVTRTVSWSVYCQSVIWTVIKTGSRFIK
jgi:hypothetical protein